MNILGHEVVLTVAVADLARANIGVGTKVPELVFGLECGKLLLQSLLNGPAVVIPALNLFGRRERQLHETFQLRGEILSWRKGRRR